MYLEFKLNNNIKAAKMIVKIFKELKSQVLQEIKEKKQSFR